MKRASAGVGERDSRSGVESSVKSKENLHEGLKDCGGGAWHPSQNAQGGDWRHGC
jgi:hypothetical protein